MEILDREDLSLLITKDGKRIYAAREGGIAPLIRATETLGLERLAGSFVADKVVGKAAALLMVYCKVRKVEAKLLSEKAIPILKRSKIPFHCQELVYEIKNRDKTGTCVFELIVSQTDDPKEAYQRLRAKVRSLKEKK